MQLNVKSELFLKIYNYVIYSVWILLLIFVIMLLSRMLYVGFSNTSDDYFVILLLFIPFIIYLFYKIFTYKYRKVWIYIVEIIITAVSLYYLFFTMIGILLFMPEFPPTPSKSQYPGVITKLQNTYYDHDLSYFPNTIPKNAQDFHANFYRNFDGYNTYYIDFIIDKEYIENLKTKYNNAILEQTKNYNTVYGIPNDCDVYFLSVMNGGCDNCKYGFAVSGETNRIYFFFQNY